MNWKCAHCGEKSSYQGHWGYAYKTPCPNGDTMRATRVGNLLKTDPEGQRLYGWMCREGHTCLNREGLANI